MKKILVIAGVSYDSIIKVDELPKGRPQTIYSKSYHETVGSTGSGKSLNLSKLGFETTFHCMIGNDDPGRKIKSYFNNKNINVLYEEDKKGTQTHTNIMDKIGRRISIYTKTRTFEPNFDYKKYEKLISDTDYLIINIVNYAKKFIPMAKKYDKKIWTDLHDYDGESKYHKEFIENSDYIFMASDNIDDHKMFMEKLIQRGKELVVCTHGKEGVTALDSAGNWYAEPIIKDYNMVDANGAGDSFFSGFLYAFSKGHDIKRCLRYATIVAGLTINSKELYNENLSQKRVEEDYKKYYVDDNSKKS